MYNVKLYFFYKLSYYSKTKQVERLLIYMLGGSLTLCFPK